MDSMVVGLIGAYVVGVVIRVALRYLLAWADAGKDMRFDPRYLVGQIVGALLGLAPVLVSSAFLEQLQGIADIASGWVIYLIAGLYGYGATALGRAGQKGVEIRRKNGKGGGPGLGALLLLLWFWK